MTKSALLDRFPILSIEISKNNTDCKNVPEILDFLKTKIEEDEFAKYIAIFNHYEHTQSIEGSEIQEGMLDAQNIIFCFGKKLSNAKVLAVRPRSIGVSEYQDKFIISLMEAPMAPMTDKMEAWVKELTK
jgi:hypothetical protein